MMLSALNGNTEIEVDALECLKASMTCALDCVKTMIIVNNVFLLFSKIQAIGKCEKRSV